MGVIKHFVSRARGKHKKPSARVTDAECSATAIDVNALTIAFSSNPSSQGSREPLVSSESHNDDSIALPEVNFGTRLYRCMGSFTSSMSTLSLPTPALSPDLGPQEHTLHASDFKLIRNVGVGAFGSVYLADHLITRTQVAVKVMDKQSCEDAAALHEQEVLRTVATTGARFIMELLGSFHDSRHFVLITAYYPRGDLKTEIARWGRLPFALGIFYAAELLLAIETVHDAGVVHRDIKAENILLSEDGHLVLADFGLARTTLDHGAQVDASASQHRRLLRSMCGTMEYIAPEMYLGQPYLFSVDVWSYAITVFHMLVGRTPWKSGLDDDESVVEQHLMRESFTDWIGTDHMATATRGFLEYLLVKDASNRPTFRDAKQHVFFADINWGMLRAGEIPVPDIGAPTNPSGPRRRSRIFFPTFDKGHTYSTSQDPYPGFHYVSPSLAPSPVIVEEAPHPPEILINDTRSTQGCHTIEIALESHDTGAAFASTCNKSRSSSALLYATAVAVATTVKLKVEFSRSRSLLSRRGTSLFRR